EGEDEARVEAEHRVKAPLQATAHAETHGDDLDRRVDVAIEPEPLDVDAEPRDEAELLAELRAVADHHRAVQGEVARLVGAVEGAAEVELAFVVAEGREARLGVHGEAEVTADEVVIRDRGAVID